MAELTDTMNQRFEAWQAAERELAEQRQDRGEVVAKGRLNPNTARRSDQATTARSIEILTNGGGGSRTHMLIVFDDAVSGSATGL